jgi:hypothetical protein
MQVSNILVPFLLLALIWTSAAAGASYFDASLSGKSKNYAMGRLVISVIIAIGITMIEWR